MINGVNALLEFMHATAEESKDCQDLLAIYCQDAEEFPFCWDKKMIATVCGRGNEPPAPPAQVNDGDWLLPDGEPITTNTFYIFQPPKSKDQDPFWIGCVKKKFVCTQTQTRTLRVCWWEMPQSQLRLPITARNYLTSVYTAEPTKTVDEYDELGLNEGITALINLESNGTRGMSLTVQGQKDAKWYSAIWSKHKDMQIAGDERIPSHLVPKGLVKVPLAKERKKPVSKNQTLAKKRPKPADEEVDVGPKRSKKTVVVVAPKRKPVALKRKPVL